MAEKESGHKQQIFQKKITEKGRQLEGSGNWLMKMETNIDHITHRRNRIKKTEFPPSNPEDAQSLKMSDVELGRVERQGWNKGFGYKFVCKILISSIAFHSLDVKSWDLDAHSPEGPALGKLRGFRKEIAPRL